VIARKATRLVQERLSRYPAVALVGARQAGKTTLARSLGGEYFDLEQEPDRLRADLIAADKRILISRTDESFEEGNRISCDLPWFLRWMEQ